MNIVELEILLQNGESEGTIKITALETKRANAIRDWFNNASDARNGHQENDSQSFSNYTVPLKYIFVSSLVSANYLFLIPLSMDVQEWLERFHIELVRIISSYNKTYIIILLFFFFLFLYTFLRQYFKFGKFFMKQDGRKFYIKNGFFNDDTNVLEKNKIKGLVIEQSLGMRWLHLSTIAVMTINNEEVYDTQSKNYLLPFVKDQQLEQYLNDYLPNYRLLYTAMPRERRLLFVDIFQCFAVLSCIMILCIRLFQVASFISYAVLFILLILISPLFRQFTSEISMMSKKFN
ncbi:PH domain-containing protein [Terrilactibacillus sp. S3-3]|nr:PH domain-containing protein [Terrilactibacillus sp. S3-3]